MRTSTSTTRNSAVHVASPRARARVSIHGRIIPCTGTGTGTAASSVDDPCVACVPRYFWPAGYDRRGRQFTRPAGATLIDYRNSYIQTSRSSSSYRINVQQTTTTVPARPRWMGQHAGDATTVLSSGLALSSSSTWSSSASHRKLAYDPSTWQSSGAACTARSK